MTTILDLNQDCLNSIFSHLTIYELIDVENTCNAFKATCELQFSSTRFYLYRIELRELKTEYLDAIFDRIGNTVRSFEFSGGYIMDEDVKQTIIRAVIDKCPNLNKLSLNYLQLTNDQFIELQKCFDRLFHLDLSHCDVNENHTDCLDGEKFENIKSLKLTGNARMSGKFFKDMKHLESLDVSFCYRLSYFMLDHFLRTCIKLRELDLSGSSQIIMEDSNILEELLRLQPNLEKLVMQNVGIERDDKILSKFKHLKHICITGRKFGLTERLNLQWGYL